jgi:hypothetical protein
LLTPGTRGFSIATLARGAIEAYGRAWWYLSAENAEELLRRWLAARANSLRWQAKATALDPVAHAENVRLYDDLVREAEGLGMARAELRINYTVLATTAIDAILGSGAGAYYYGWLSAVAHAERSGLSSALTRIGDAPIPGASAWAMGLSEQMLAQTLFPMVVTHGLALDATIKYFGVGTAARDAWIHQLKECDLLMPPPPSRPR